jgi:hypothetical protein
MAQINETPAVEAGARGDCLAAGRDFILTLAGEGSQQSVPAIILAHLRLDDLRLLGGANG